MVQALRLAALAHHHGAIAGAQDALSQHPRVQSAAAGVMGLTDAAKPAIAKPMHNRLTGGGVVRNFYLHLAAQLDLATRGQTSPI